LRLASRSLFSALNSPVLSCNLKMTKSHVSNLFIWQHPKLDISQLSHPSPCCPESWVRGWQVSRERLAHRPLNPLSAKLKVQQQSHQSQATPQEAQSLPQCQITPQEAPSPPPPLWLAQVFPASHLAPLHREGLSHLQPLLSSPQTLLLQSPPPLRQFPPPSRQRETLTQQQRAAAWRRRQVPGILYRTSSLTQRRLRG